MQHEVLDAAALVARWPAWHVSDEVVAIYQDDAGIVAASRANAVHRRLALARGADLLPETRVVRIVPDGAGFALETATRTIRCGSLVIAADAWMNEVLANFGVRLPLRILQEQVTYFDAADAPSFDPARFPVWIWHSDPHMYGLPSFGQPGPKVAIHGGGPEVTPETRTFEPDLGYAAAVDGFIREHLPGAVGPPIEVRTCLYTLTPDQDFVLDLVPGTSNVSLALGTAHGFKFASAIRSRVGRPGAGWGLRVAAASVRSRSPGAHRARMTISAVSTPGACRRLRGTARTVSRRSRGRRSPAPSRRRPAA